MNTNKMTEDSELEQVAGGIYPNRPTPGYYCTYCESCGHVLYRIPQSVGNLHPEGEYYCPVCGTTTHHKCILKGN